MSEKEVNENAAFQDACNIYNDLLKFKQLKKKSYDYDNKNDENEEINIKELNEFHTTCEKKYEKFFYSFPIIARFIIFSGMFSEICLKKLFKYYFAFDEAPKTYEDFCDRQCHYVYLYNLELITSLCNKNGGRKLKKEILENKAKIEKEKIKEKLVEEYNNFMKLIEEVKVNDKEKDSQLKKDRLRNIILSLKNKEQTED